MYNSILKKISDYAKENNISLNGFYYNFSEFFPESFYETVINYLISSNPNYNNEKPIYDFYIGFDKNKNAYFQFIGKDKKTQFIVLQNGTYYDFMFPKSLKIKEAIFLENIKNLDNAKNNHILSDLPIDFVKRFIKHQDEVSSIDNSLDLMTNEICKYMSYLDEELNFTYSILDHEIETAKEIEKIYFVESEPSINRVKSTENIPKEPKQRKHEEIPFEERKQILDGYQAENTFEAKSKNTPSIYYVKIFKTNGKYKLVTEPKEATKYTKIIYINKDILSKEEAIKIVIDSLELSRNEITEADNITRHSHTTLEEYKKLLEYILNEKNLGLNSSTKKRIDEATGTKKR